MPAEYVGGIGVQGVSELKSFVEAGGTLIAIDGATDVPILHFGSAGSQRARGREEHRVLLSGIAACG